MRLLKLFPLETLRMALDSLRAHKFRSFLTVLGIVIGVTTAIAIASILTGLRQNIVAIIEEYGTNNTMLFISRPARAWAKTARSAVASL